MNEVEKAFLEGRLQAQEMYFRKIKKLNIVSLALYTSTMLILIATLLISLLR